MTLPQAASEAAAIPIALHQQGRLCWGMLHLQADALHFVCLHDESAAAAAAGRATAAQFGLVGGLIGGAIAGVKAAQRQKALAAATERIRGLSLPDQLKQHALSRSFQRAEIRGYAESRWSGKAIQTTGGKFPVTVVADDSRKVLTDWLGARGLPVTLVKPLSLRTKLILFGSPVWLAAAYLLIAMPWAIKKSSHMGAVSKRYAEVLAAGKAAVLAIPDRPSGADALAACGQLTPVGRDGIAGYVGEVPGGADRELLADYERFPRTAESMAYSGRTEVFSQEISRWPARDSFGSAYASILGEAPTDWGRRVKDVYPLRDFTGARYLAVAKVRALRPPSEQGYAGPIRPGRADLGVRVIDLVSGGTLCEGDLTVAFPSSRASAGSPSRAKDALTDGLAAAAMAAPCRAGGDDLCAGVAAKLDRLAPGTPDPAAAAPPDLAAAATLKASRHHHRHR